ncbi:hypothetical protein RFI_03883 [Reticulomyxa filosa]|uniref:Uncharacterized protein n=1 Tax=Reticulomyxa filosa TaxID=46433 RepID=X6P560_RETFI|nr:hypothetical protein RFI_03883 [Reticulomyxa filosa]|eukprot:ETO33224.1 hypothetical protein RFI_03883 [Reticulomyxa filosa]
MFAEDAMEIRVDTVTLDLGIMAIGASRQLDEILIAMILGEAEADADGNEDNEYSGQANEQEDSSNNPNLPPEPKRMSLSNKCICNSNKCNNKSLKVSMVKNSDISHRHQVEEDEAVALLRVILEEENIIASLQEAKSLVSLSHLSKPI